MKSERHVRAKPRASRLMILARRPFGFTRGCETSASREVRDDAILREVEVPFEGRKDVCEVVHIAGDAEETSDAVLQDIMTKYNEVICVDTKTWSETSMSSRQWSSRTWLVRLHRAWKMARCATNRELDSRLEEPTLTGVNQFTDLTKEEFESTYLGYKPQNVSKLVTT